MPLKIEFTKMSGAGNDFVVIDNRDGSISCDKASLARTLCSRHFGIGADGMLLLERSTVATFSMQYYNADGSYGGMCGNGGRCLARYAFHHGITHQLVTFDALDHIYSAEITEPNVRLKMKSPAKLRRNLAVRGGSREFKAHFVDTGSPHVVLETPDVDVLDIVQIGSEIRHSSLFQPEGTNVNFIQQIGSRALKLRTYERGVEAETLACGTGAVASAIIGAIAHNMEPPVTLLVRSGEELTVDFKRHDTSFTHVVLEGSAHFVFTGVAFFDDKHRVMVDVHCHESEPAF